MSERTMDGVRRASSSPLDLRVFVNESAQMAPASAMVPSHESVSIEPDGASSTRLFSLLAFTFIAVIFLATGATTFAYSRRQASVSLPAVADVKSVAVAGQPSSGQVVVPAGTTPTSSRLQAILDRFTASDRASWGIVVTDLKTGVTANVNGGQQIESASLYKLFVATGIYQAIDNGQLNYSDAAGGGSGMDVRTCLQYMITVSDNLCGRALGAKLGWEAMNPSLRSAGYVATDMAGPAQRTSAADVALLYRRLYDGTLVSPNSTNEFLALLKGQLVNNRLPVGLPIETVIAHKTGDLDGYTHDAGIVYGPKTDYLVSVMSGPWSEPANQAGRFGELSSQLYAYFEH